MKNFRDTATYLLIAALIVLFKTVLIFFPVDHPLASQSFFSWPWIASITAGGLLALFLAGHAGFPGIWEQKITSRQRFLIPMLAGILFFVIQIPISLLLKIPNIHIPFPHSVPVYGLAALLLELLFHVIPISLFVWLISTVILKRKWSSEVFITGAIVISLYEPVTQMGALISMGIVPGYLWAAVIFLFIYAANLTPLVLFRRYGVFGAFFFRIIFYLMWHVIWPLILF